MRDITLKIMIGLVLSLWVIGMILTGIKLVNFQKDYNNKDEQIKILEQSLQEQIQEKEVYMKMVEQKKEGEQKWEL